MIAGLSGNPSIQGGLNENEVIIKTPSGVDYLVKVAAADRHIMATTDNVSIWCVTRYSQETGSILWGGMDISARRRFNNLLKIPRLAGKVAIELAHPAAQILLMSQNAKVIAKNINGLGAKMAQTIVMNLEGILDESEAEIKPISLLSSAMKPDIRKDIITAMRSLGFSHHEAVEAVKLVEQRDDAAKIDITNGIKLALQHIKPKVFEMKES